MGLQLYAVGSQRKKGSIDAPVTFAFGAVPALVTLVRGPRGGAIVAAGASGLLALAMLVMGRPIPVGLIYSMWVLGPPLLLAAMLRRSESLTLCLQVAVLGGAVLVLMLHATLGDPERFWAPFVRDLAHEAAPIYVANGDGEARTSEDGRRAVCDIVGESGDERLDVG